MEADKDKWNLYALLNIVSIFAAASIAQARECVEPNKPDKNELYNNALDCFEGMLRIELKLPVKHPI